jgi:hypothetical protein
MIDFDLQPLASLRANVEEDFVLYANNIECFPSGGCLKVPSNYKIPISIYASSCSGYVGGTK